MSKTDKYEKAFAHCDVLVIGGRPAGIVAAHAAVQSGADVILADEDYRFGGRLLGESLEVDGQGASDIWVPNRIVKLMDMSNVCLMDRTTITGATKARLVRWSGLATIMRIAPVPANVSGGSWQNAASCVRAHWNARLRFPTMTAPAS